MKCCITLPRGTPASSAGKGSWIAGRGLIFTINLDLPVIPSEFRERIRKSAVMISVFPAQEVVKKFDGRLFPRHSVGLQPTDEFRGEGRGLWRRRTDSSQICKILPPLRNFGAMARWAPPFAGKTNQFLRISTST